MKVVQSPLFISFNLLDYLMELHRILTLNKGLYFNNVHFDAKCHIMERVFVYSYD